MDIYQQSSPQLGTPNNPNALIAPPPGNMPTGSGVGTPIGGSGGGSYDPVAAANATYIADQNRILDEQSGRADTQFGIGNENVMNQYNAAFQKLMNDKAIAERNYNTTRTQTQQDNIEAKSSINDNVRNQYTGLQRLLGARGAGNSSAARIVAPFAAGRTGNIQRAQVQKSYGRNIGSLDTNWGDTTRQFDDSTGDLGSQKENNLRTNRSKYDEVKARILGQRASIDPNNRATYENQAKDLFNEVDQLGRNIIYTPKPVDIKPVNLDQYNYDRFGAPVNGSGATALSQGVGPYWSLLNGREEEKKASVI